RSLEEIELIFQVLHHGIEWIARSSQPKAVLDVLLVKCATAEALVYVDAPGAGATASVTGSATASAAVTPASAPAKPQRQTGAPEPRQAAQAQAIRQAIGASQPAPDLAQPQAIRPAAAPAQSAPVSASAQAIPDRSVLPVASQLSVPVASVTVKSSPATIAD